MPSYCDNDQQLGGRQTCAHAWFGRQNLRPSFCSHGFLHTWDTGLGQQQDRMAKFLTIKLGHVAGFSPFLCLVCWWDISGFVLCPHTFFPSHSRPSLWVPFALLLAKQKLRMQWIPLAPSVVVVLCPMAFETEELLYACLHTPSLYFPPPYPPFLPPPHFPCPHTCACSLPLPTTTPTPLQHAMPPRLVNPSLVPSIHHSLLSLPTIILIT